MYSVIIVLFLLAAWESNALVPMKEMLVDFLLKIHSALFLLAAFESQICILGFSVILLGSYRCLFLNSLFFMLGILYLNLGKT